MSDVGTVAWLAFLGLAVFPGARLVQTVRALRRARELHTRLTAGAPERLTPARLRRYQLLVLALGFEAAAMAACLLGAGAVVLGGPAWTLVGAGVVGVAALYAALLLHWRVSRLERVTRY